MVFYYHKIYFFATMQFVTKFLFSVESKSYKLNRNDLIIV